MKKYLSYLISHISSQKGFTLIELLVAMGIIGILSSFLLANFVGVRQRTRDGVRKFDIRQIQLALENYRADQADYPASFSECGSSFVLGGTVYMQKIPCDPLGGSYTYSSNGSTYTITACLENSSDSQKDSSTNPACTVVSYTLQNP